MRMILKFRGQILRHTGNRSFCSPSSSTMDKVCREMCESILEQVKKDPSYFTSKRVVEDVGGICNWRSGQPDPEWLKEYEKVIFKDPERLKCFIMLARNAGFDKADLKDYEAERDEALKEKPADG
ncbi:UDP-N-acetylglucosamine--N-acetylmuramyl-(pentapeptide) pyrophosphoryl-undecaprenol N-acetylglucosaminetransferase [Striga asiatica]|uniref:UDP-N-acetylglucosamine--N-acetylmuramyl-(Pentapeptide) pyrophosphoryl-undecaprenol N-acetylglucosaminetransferase n=1 Tax=Striga asiatica TaxID=4170 RepID=A0A5A7QVH2_STRAF|nr:UDP-N-acetylglucosamine--N-acetylmuramyl-(pentapeptide) pyrophosphoryl-undecaprenol N-acetylglucosaminetransferase [Striga asiatica]